MPSRTLVNIALFLTIVLLAVYIYETDQLEQASSTNEQLTQLPAEEVTQIIIRHNQRRIELKRQHGKWHMLELSLIHI